MDPSSSSLVPFSSFKRPKNDVFVNYSVEDTGNNFVSHLKAALKLHSFTISDHNTLPIGQDVSSELLKAIEDSHIYVVVFSTNYSLSIKSLDELVLIMDSLSKFKNRKVFPVFLNVDPSDVRNLRRCFEEAFQTHEGNVDPERVHKWKQALKDAGGRSGLALQNGDEADFVKKIVRDLKKIQLPLPLFNADHHVGIEPRAQAIISMLGLEDDRHFPNIVAVLGISGSGKTTIVKAVYDIISAHFDYNCFIEDIRLYKSYGAKWKVKLQRDVLRRLTGNDRFHNNVGEAQIKKFIESHKALLVLDDVEKNEELQALGIPSASLDSGSRIIVTTTNKGSLGNLPYTPYDMKLLNRKESFELFVGLAYGEGDLVDEKFVKEIVEHAGGLPLVVEVWGRHFKAHERKLWGRLLETLKRIPHEDIQMKLRMSYDSLTERSKKLFLDIVFFFDGFDVDLMFKVLEDEDAAFFPQIEIQRLLDRGLVRKHLKEMPRKRRNGDDRFKPAVYHHEMALKMKDRVVLHQVIGEMGLEVVRQENEDEPGQRTRLTDQRDVLRVLENNSGTDSVESIILDTTNLNYQSIQEEAFTKMSNLRFIEFKRFRSWRFDPSNDMVNVEWVKPISFKHLKYLEWDDFPWRRIHNDMGNVVVIKLICSKLEILWEGFKNLKKLRILDVSRSMSLTRTGSFIGLENLEELNLSGCYNLKEVDSSIVCLQKLLLLELSSCSILKSTPNLLRNIKISQGSYFTNLVNLPSNMSELQSLTTLSLNGCMKLGSEGLMKVTGLRNLQKLSMINCNVSQVSSEIGNLVSLQKLSLSGNTFCSLPDSFSNLSQLVCLNIADCSKLQYLPLLPSNLEKIVADGCSSLDVMPFDSMRKANIFRSKLFEELTTPLQIGLSVKEVPYWCCTDKVRGNVFSIVAPIHLDKKICGVILCTIQRQGDTYDWELPKICNKTKETSHRIDTRKFYERSSMDVMFYPLNDKTLMVEAGDTVELHFVEGKNWHKDMFSCGLSLIYEGDVIDSTLVIQNRNVTHEHTFRVPSPSSVSPGTKQRRSATKPSWITRAFKKVSPRLLLRPLSIRPLRSHLGSCSKRQRQGRWRGRKLSKY